MTPPLISEQYIDDGRGPWYLWKFELINQTTRLRLPRTSRILAVAAQHNAPRLWVMAPTTAVVDDYSTLEIRYYGTGHMMLERPSDHVGIILLDDGGTVLHIFASWHYAQPN